MFYELKRVDEKGILEGFPYLSSSEFNYNKMLEPNIEVSLDEARQFTEMFTPSHIAFQQLRLPAFCSLSVYFYHDRAYAIERAIRGKKARAWRLGCLHKNSVVTHRSNCYTEWKCPDCGVTGSIDTSD